MANTITLFGTNGFKSGGYPRYTPIEPETFKISNTEFSFDLPRSYKDNLDNIKLNATPVTSEPLKITPIATATQRTATKMAAASTTTSNLALDTKKLELSQKVIDKATAPAEKAAKYLQRAQIATGVEAAAQIGQGVITLANANAGVDAVERAAQMRETNLAQTEAVMYENMRDTMAQLDMVAAAKNVDLTSSAIVGQKERGLSDMGKDIRSKELAIKFQNAVDKYNALKQKEAAKAQGNLQIAQGVLTAASLFI